MKLRRGVCQQRGGCGVADDGIKHAPNGTCRVQRMANTRVEEGEAAITAAAAAHAVIDGPSRVIDGGSISASSKQVNVKTKRRSRVDPLPLAVGVMAFGRVGVDGVVHG